MTALLTRQPSQVVAATGAASVAIRGLVLGPVRPVAVLGIFPSAIYLSTGDGSVAALVTSEAARLPCGVVVEFPDLPTASGLSTESRSAGATAATISVDGATVGGGRVAVGRLRVEVTRWWRPMPPAPPPDASVLGRGLAALAERLAVQQHRLLRMVADPARRLEAAIRVRDPRAAAEAATPLLGVGPGLTPSGDDVLAGVLIGLHHLDWTRAEWPRASEPVRLNGVPGRPTHGTVTATGVRDAIATRVLADARSRTTTLSAALLAHAAHGEAASEAAAVLNSLCGRRPLSPALMRLLAIGHSSGYDTACGILAAGRALLGQRESG